MPVQVTKINPYLPHWFDAHLEEMDIAVRRKFTWPC